MCLEDLARDLFLAVRGEAVENESIGLCVGHDGRVDLIALECLAADGGFALLTHRCPDVGVERIGIGGCLGDRLGAEEAARRFSPLHDLGIGLVSSGACDRNAHARENTADDEGVCHVVTVADEAELLALEIAAELADRLQVSKHLAGVRVVGETVDYRDRAVFCHVLDLLLVEGADHDAVEVAREHADGVRGLLAAADLQVVRGEEESLAAELVHTHLKGNAGTCRGLAEDHAEGLALEIGLLDTRLALGFELVGEVEYRIKFFFCKIGEFEKMFHGNFLSVSL